MNGTDRWDKILWSVIDPAIHNWLGINWLVQGEGVTPMGAVSRAATVVKIFDRLKIALTT